MSAKYVLPIAPLGVLLALTGATKILAADIEEVVVWGSLQEHRSEPAVTLQPQDIAAVNIVTTEDLVKYEPSLIIRRRFIGDANGTMGIRGANMFQTSRSMVFGDGVPLHYLLQSRWDGAPRWSMMAASEIERIEILYGPFSAEYSGNAMGGVILMESKIPQQREVHFDSTAFSQNFSAYGVDDTLQGYKSFISYGDKINDVSLYLSYNHLQNSSQPQTYYMGTMASRTSFTPVTGGISGFNERGIAGVYFGDTGSNDNTTDNFKLKLGYELGDWSTLLNLAYEDRSTAALAPNNYLQDANVDPVWGGTVVQDEQFFSVPASRFGVSSGQRHSLSGGLRIKGSLSNSVSLESNISWFGVLEDEKRTSARNPLDAAYTPAGQVNDFGDSGWQTAELKLGFSDLGVDGLSMLSGFRHEQYKLNIAVFDSEDYAAGLKNRYSARSGGETEVNAAFTQVRWEVADRWELNFGLRYEAWQSHDGYYGKDQSDTPLFDLKKLPTRKNDKFSPKFSLGFFPDSNWTLRYSAARAYRFAIVEELFSQYQAFNAVNSANPDLAPENGLHQNLAFQRQLDRGELRINIFQENIKDVIEAQSLILAGGISVRTFLPVTEVQTRGVEFISNLDDLFITGLNLRFNLVYTHAEIINNETDPSIAGKRFPRMPDWRANLLLNCRLSPTLELGAGLRYASNSYGQLNNSDRQSQVYGAQDDFLFTNIKATWTPKPKLQLGFGIDNLFNEVAYVAHPWPARTLFMELSVDL